MRFRTKPAEIEAYQWNGGDEVLTWARNVSSGAGTSLLYVKDFEQSVAGATLACKEDLSIKTWEGTMKVSLGDWVVCGLLGEFYACKPAAFELKYERIDA